MMAKGIEQEFAERVFDQIRGFGEYGFPESHAASFALIAYATAWMKCYYPEVFACSLLNAQPMGFYAPSTIVEDAKRQDVRILPIDIQGSVWDCTLERISGGARPFAVRMGFRYVKGLQEAQAGRIEKAREAHAFTSLEDAAARAELDEGAMMRLAEAGAFSDFQGNRRAALWEACGVTRAPRSSLPLEVQEGSAEFQSLDPFESIAWDYRTSYHSPRGHLLEPLRAELAARNLPDARTVNGMPDGRVVRYAGMVICRQRPGTASGVVFMSLEDESGFVNVVVWERVYEKHAVLIKTAAFIGVTGKLQVQDGVTHLIASDFWIPRFQQKLESPGSHDFH
jgi:error-prone DNA polymerase